LLNDLNRPYHTITDHTIPDHTISQHTIPYHSIPNYIISYHIIDRTIPYHFIASSCVCDSSNVKLKPLPPAHKRWHEHLTPTEATLEPNRFHT